MHTHIGENDPDGFSCQPEDLVGGRSSGSPGRAAVFAMHEPDGYAAANDRVIAEAERSDGTARGVLPPRSRAPSRWPRPSAASRPARSGIKLHPRAEAFELATPELREVFALADRSGGCRCSCTRARDPRARPARGRAVRAPSRDCA